MRPVATAKRWDLFCQVIDNHGDLGVCWRLAAELAAHGHTVRLWVDDASALPWMAPGALQGQWPGVEVRDWSAASNATMLRTLAPAEVWVEGFGCTLPEAFVAHRCMGGATAPAPVWINLEYLSAEAYVERSHGLPSPILYGPAAGQTRHFFYPGFTARTGGLLRETDLAQRQARFDAPGWRLAQGLPAGAGPWHSLFCYEPAALAGLLRQLLVPGRSDRLLVTHGRARAAVQSLLDAGLAGQLDLQRLHWLPAFSQRDYDHLLWACDSNFVRGEDSLVRALWAGKPWVWHIYPQNDGAHHAKLEALMQAIGLPEPWRAFQRQWNAGTAPSALQPYAPGAWTVDAIAVQQHLLCMPTLTQQLLAFAEARTAVSGSMATENR